MFRELPYDPIRDFAPIGFLAETAYILGGPDRLPRATWRALIALAKEKPGALTFSYGNQSAHIATATMARMANVEWRASPTAAGRRR